MNQNASINLVNCSVEGLDTLKRADSIRNAFINGVTLQSSAILILSDINFSCKTGEKIAFIGDNGSGKSSLLKVISNIYPTKSGKRTVNGHITAIIEMGIGIEPELTGRQNIKILMLYNNMLDKYNKEIEKSIIDFSELGDKIDWQVKNYSSGMLARLTFSASIFQTPDIFFQAYDFWLTKNHIYHKSQNQLNQIQQVLQQPKTKFKKTYKHKNFTPIISRQDYKKSYQQSKQHITQGDIYQLNLTHCLKGETQKPSPKLFLDTISSNPVQYSAYIQTPQFQIISASPERFIKIDNMR